jgi:hypothetical protein
MKPFDVICGADPARDRTVPQHGAAKLDAEHLLSPDSRARIDPSEIDERNPRPFCPPKQVV